MKNVKDLYNEVAIKTGFPIYTNDTDTPETTRFLLNVLSDALRNVIDGIYTKNNVLERTDTIITKAGEYKYGIDGIIKGVQLVERDENNPNKIERIIRLPYNMDIDPNVEPELLKLDKPTSYYIKKGYLALDPCPDKEYELKVSLSTNDLVLSNNDVSKNYIDDIDDTIYASADFCNVVVLRACTFIFARCANANAQYYNDITQRAIRSFIEKDFASMEAPRKIDSSAGHYDSGTGLLG